MIVASIFVFVLAVVAVALWKLLEPPMLICGEELPDLSRYRVEVDGEIVSLRDLHSLGVAHLEAPPVEKCWQASVQQVRYRECREKLRRRLVR